jgi:hypothetical protein
VTGHNPGTLNLPAWDEFSPFFEYQKSTIGFLNYYNMATDDFYEVIYWTSSFWDNCEK